MRNLNILNTVIRLLEIDLSLKIGEDKLLNPKFKKLFEYIIEFLYYFCKDNLQNQQLLIHHSDKILDLILYQLEPAKLIAEIF